MATRANGYYNDPAFAQAFANLGQAFAPPSATETYAYARAGREQAEAAREAEGYNLASQFLTPQQMAFMKAAGGEAYLKNYCQYELDQTAAQPGTDPRALDARVYARTGNAPNTFAGQQVAERGALEREIIKPLANNTSRTLPGQIADMYGLPEEQAGPIVVGAGQTYRAPDGTTMRGETNVKAGETSYPAVFQASPGRDPVAAAVEPVLKPQQTNAGAQAPDVAKDGSRVADTAATLTAAQPDASAPAGGPAATQAPVENSMEAPDRYGVDTVVKGPADASKSGEIRKEIISLPSYKNYQQALPIWQSMLETADTDTRASDLNLIYGIGKIFDPNSVVREGEMTLAQATSNLPDKLAAKVTSELQGTSALSPDTRKALMAEAKVRMGAYDKNYRNDLKFYSGVAKRGGFNEADVIPELEEIKDYTPKAKPAAAQSYAVGTVARDQSGKEVEWNGKEWVAR